MARTDGSPTSRARRGEQGRPPPPAPRRSTVIPEEVVSRIESADWFRSSFSPCALLDADLRIGAVNAAFLRVAGGLSASRIVGQVATEVLAANPDDPGADASAALVRSVQGVLSTGQVRWLGIHRHDLPDPHRPGAFLYREWLPVHIPVVHQGAVVGVLHHVQDLTPAPTAGRPAPWPLPDHSDALARASERLRLEFPGASTELVLTVLTDSARVVARVLGEPDPARAAELARLRLEVLTGAPAAPV